LLLKLIYLLEKNYKHKTLYINGKAFDALVADTSAKRAIGLMFRRSLKNNECMLFEFSGEARYGIWMHNMYFSIDIIWLDSRMRVVDIVREAKPCRLLDCKTYLPKGDAKYVVELKAGALSNISNNALIKVKKQH